jgi:uncharacterized repeat protein (TIGR03837 family)
MSDPMDLVDLSEHQDGSDLSFVGLRWDIFCRVIDNFGDIGVCWRLAAALAARGQQVRLWVDDASALAWMAPQGCAGVQVMPWQPDQPMPHDASPGDVVIEAFACEIDHAWVASKTIANKLNSTLAKHANHLQKTIGIPIWLNLEYLSAEAYVARSHGLPSPVMEGAAKGLNKWFFYPGFTPGTGGLIREPDAQPAPTPRRDAALAENHYADPDASAAQRISLFCYEPPALTDLLQQCADAPQPTQMLLMPGRGMQHMRAVLSDKTLILPNWNMHFLLSIHEQNHMTQAAYDDLLRSCELNFVRGEDSLVRAIWAGRALVWQIYPQADGAHAVKLEAFLDWLQAPADLREFHRVWNGLSQAKLPNIAPQAWQECILAAKNRLLAQTDLVSQLLDFVEEKRILAA